VVHQFAQDVVPPAAAEYAEREDFPWDVLQEAAKIGLYAIDFFATQSFEESGLGIPLAMEELFWGDAGIGLAIVGTSLAAASVSANGTPEQIGQWFPAMFGTEAEPKVAAFCSSEPDAGSDVGAMRTRAVYDEKTDEWVLNGTKTWATNGGIADIHVVNAVVDPELEARGHASFIVPPGGEGHRPGPEVPQARHPRLAHRRGRAGGLPDPGRFSSLSEPGPLREGWPRLLRFRNQSGVNEIAQGGWSASVGPRLHSAPH
jgi:alkylation response protein AidB-like acyl-CoA dehydrogenase